MRRHLFKVWAPTLDSVGVHIVAPVDGIHTMTKTEAGYFEASVDSIDDSTRYFFHLDGKDLPDPASAYQPEGVHGPSAIVRHADFKWTDAQWKGIPFADLVLYELHVGTFTQEGTFDAVIPRLKDLVDIGVNAIEIMPVAQFPGERNWGYDGVFPYAAQNSYGGPAGLKRLVDACHETGIAVFLDVVYNHLGPEGNYFSTFAPYFSKAYKVVWGDAINYDGEWSDGVRDFFVDNVEWWFRHFHIDGLRLDAIHAIFDSNAVNIFELMTARKESLERELGRSLYMVAESDLNDPKVVKSPAIGGLGFDAAWLDDFHHAWTVLLDPPSQSRYEDFGKPGQLAKAYKDGYVHSGEFVKFRKRSFGASSADVDGSKFIVFLQNHDQIGNRPDGNRLTASLTLPQLKIAAAAIFLSPYIPMLFMGEEYGETAPFYFFTSHSDEELIKKVEAGRKKEFSAFGDLSNLPAANDEDTFNQSRLRWDLRKEGEHKELLAWYKQLATLRRTEPALKNTDKQSIECTEAMPGTLMLQRVSTDGNQSICCCFNFSTTEQKFMLAANEKWEKILDASTCSSGMERETEISVASMNVVVLRRDNSQRMS